MAGSRWQRMLVGPILMIISMLKSLVRSLQAAHHRQPRLRKVELWCQEKARTSPHFWSRRTTSNIQKYSLAGRLTLKSRAFRMHQWMKYWWERISPRNYLKVTWEINQKTWMISFMFVMRRTSLIFRVKQGVHRMTMRPQTANELV